jgi:hypothetical protein
MKQKLISFEKENYEKALRLSNNDLLAYNKILTAIIKNVPGVEINIENIEAIYNNPKEYTFDCLVGDTPLNIAGVTVNKQKAMDLIDLPQSWLNVINVALPIKADFEKTTTHEISRDEHISRVSFSDIELKNDCLILGSDYVTNLKCSYSVYTQNEKQNEAYDLLTGIHANLLKLSKLGVTWGPDIPDMQQLGFVMGDTLRLESYAAIRSL